MTKAMKYDVVIRCKNEMDWLPRVIDSINNQTVKPSNIILVDNGSEDCSVEYANERGCTLVEYDKDVFNYSYALNIGIKISIEKEVLILSAHFEIIGDESIMNMIEVRHLYNAAGVYGRQIPTVDSNPVDTRDLVTVFGRERIVFEKYPFFHNAFSLIDREAWEDCPFDEKQNGIEDRFWARLQALKGRKIVYEPESVVYHEHGLNQGASMERALRVCKYLKELHEDDIFSWPNFD